MKYNLFIYIACLLVSGGCQNSTKEKEFSVYSEINRLPHIYGEKKNGDYLYVTAGNMIYSIGNQYGQFPETGFHVPGEMGGIWQHPIKLVDGYRATVVDQTNNMSLPLEQCEQFITYPLTNRFDYFFPAQNLIIRRTEFIPDSLPVVVVEYLLQNQSSQTRAYDFLLDIDSDLSPVWLGERNGMIDSRDQLIEGINSMILIQDSLNSWYAGITVEDHTWKIRQVSDSEWKGMGITVSTQLSTITLQPGEEKSIRFYIGGSMKSPMEVEQNIQVARENLPELLKQKINRFEQIDRRAEITIPDTLLMKAYQWGKYNTDWLIRDVPGMGRAMSAGLPDYPWFFSNDQGITFRALVGTISPELFYHSWEMMKRVSEGFNGPNGRVIHEVSTNGSVYDKGRMEESQEFFIAAWHIFEWTGNKEFLKIYYGYGKKTWEFLKEHDTNNNLYIEGYGGVEIEGLNDEMLDVQVHTQVFLECMSKAAGIFGEHELSTDYASKAAMLKHNINRDWWSESENRYFDFISDKQKAVELIDMALDKRIKKGRNHWAREKLQKLKQDILTGEYTEKGYNVFYNGASILPLAEGIADPEKALKALEGISFFTNKYGMYIAGVARPDDIRQDEGSVVHRLEEEEFNYNEAIMIAGTSRLAVAASRYKSIDAAMEYIQLILNNFSFATPGSTYEVSPDYGMFVQAWNVAGLNIPLIHYIFGVHPEAWKQEIRIKPDIPSGWEYAKLDNLLIGNNELSIHYKLSGEKRVYTILSEKEDWTIHFQLPENTKQIKINGEKTDIQSGTISLNGIENKIEF